MHGAGVTVGRYPTSKGREAPERPVNPKGNQSLIFIGMTDAEAETPILGPLDEKNGHLGKDPDAGKD